MELTIYHTNDIHSHLNEYARIQAYMAKHRPQLEHPSLYIDIGDHVDLSAPVTEATVGQKNIELLNEAHCDIATIGNNEGMTISHDALQNLYNDADFKVICTNVINTPKYKLNESSVRYLLKKEPTKDPGSSPNRNIKPFFISTCLVF